MSQPITTDTVLWITPDQCHLDDRPNGFALRVIELLGPANPAIGSFYVRGQVIPLTPEDLPGDLLVLAVTEDQQRAVRLRPPTVITPPAPSPPPPPSPPQMDRRDDPPIYRGIARVPAWHDLLGPPTVRHGPPPGYQRVWPT